MWLPINDTHEVSVSGEVRNRRTLKILKAYRLGNYLGLRFAMNAPKHYIHHIVAGVFLPAPTEEKCVIDHINRDKHDNRAENLRWVSRSVNGMNRTIELKPRKDNEHHHIYAYTYGWKFQIRIDGKLIYKLFGKDELDACILFRDNYITQQCPIKP